MLTGTLPSVILLFSLAVFALASDITTFTDEKCMRSWRALDTVNGYPDGLCKPLNVTEGQSFQIQKLDPGCAGVCPQATFLVAVLIVESYIVW